MRVQISLMLATALALAPMGARAQAPVACAAIDQGLPAPFAGWSAKAPLASAAKVADLSKALLVIGQGADADLHPTSEVAYAALPEKPGGSVSHGGMFSLVVSQPGVYAVALGSGAWIDLLKGKVAVESVAHGHGPDCSSIRKVVDFQLGPGRYVVQVSADAEPKLAIMIARRP